MQERNVESIVKRLRIFLLRGYLIMKNVNFGIAGS